MFLGLRTIIYPAADLTASRDWYAKTLDIEPYFDQPFYVCFTVGGYELALDPNADPTDGAVTYWGMADADESLEVLLANGAQPHSDVRDVDDGIRVATVREEGGTILGIIENPHFHLEPVNSALGGPGR
ncbi:MAG: VOC family protein [Lacisediminihabitans sp.]